MADEAILVGRKLRHGSSARERREVAGAILLVPLANVPQRRSAARRVIHANGAVDLAAGAQRARSQRRLDVLKIVALEKRPDVGAGVKDVAANVLEVVVDGVEEDLAVAGAHVRRAAGDVVDPVAGEGVEILLANEQHRPVVLSVARRRPLRDTVELVVGDGHMAGGAPSRHNHLAADEGELVVVDPDHVGAAPNVLRVQFGDVDVLDDDVARAAADAEALAHNDAGIAYADDALVAGDVDGVLGRVVVGAVDPGARRIAGILDPGLAFGGSAGADGCRRVAAALADGDALAFAEVPSLVDHDNTRGVVGESRYESVSRSD